MFWTGEAAYTAPDPHQVVANYMRHDLQTALTPFGDRLRVHQSLHVSILNSSVVIPARPRPEQVVPLYRTVTFKLLPNNNICKGRITLAQLAAKMIKQFSCPP